MGLFSKKPLIDPEEIWALHQELTEIRLRLEASERSRAELERQLQQLDVSTAALAAKSQVIDDVSARLAEVDVLKGQIAQLDVVSTKVNSLDGVTGQLAELADRVTATADEAKVAKDQAAALQQRVAEVSTELANQFGELSGEIEGLTRSKSTAEPVVAEQPISAEVIEQLHGAQIRLANEQARYEIAFRQDLASLAEQVRRTRNER